MRNLQDLYFWKILQETRIIYILQRLQLVSKKKANKPRQGLVALLDSLNKQPATSERKAAKEAAVKTYRKSHPKSAERE